MARTIIDLPPAQMRDLDALCASLGISRAEAIRRAVHAFLLKPTEEGSHCFGLWARGREGDEEDAQKPDDR